MLTLALAATLLGFVLLILGLITGTVWLAVACIVVCLVGLGFLLADVFAGRKGEAGRSLEEMVPGAGRDATDSDAERAPVDEGAADTPTRRHPVSDAAETADPGPSAYRPGSFEPGMAAPESTAPPSRPAPERREGTLEDYLRSVGADAPSANDPAPGVAPDGARAAGGPPGPAGRPTPQRYGSPPAGPVPPQPGSEQQSRAPQPPRPQAGQFVSGSPQSSGQPGRPQPWGQRPPAAPSSGQQRPFDPTQSEWAPDNAPGGDTPGPDDWSTPHERPDDSASRRRRPDFDPLDPNWHPPAD